MFKKRRSNSSLRQAPTNPPAPSTPSAATAAAQAFLKKTQDESQLSNAAAAAALRSQTSTPASIADIQTKRMVRRASVSSIGSAGSAASRQPFSSQSQQRRGSNSSMTSRSFRSPSPGAHAGAPPVPSLPSDVPPIPSKSAMRTSRTSSIDSNTRSVLPSHQNGGIASSSWAAADRRQTATPVINTSIDRNSAASPTSGSPRNVNFSRPMSPSMGPMTGSPNAAPLRPRPASSLGLTQEQYNRLREQGNLEQLRAVSGSPNSAGQVTMVFDPASRKMVPAIIQHDLMSQNTRPASQSRAQQQGGSMVYDPASRKMVPAGRTLDAVPERDYTHTASGQPARAMSLTSAHIAAAKRMTSPVPRMASPEAVALARGERISSPPPQAARVSSPPPVSARPSQPVARASSMGAVPAPTAEQIRAFQTRAASMLARPQSQLPAAPPPKQAPRPTSMLMRSPSAEVNKAADTTPTRQVPSTPITVVDTASPKGRTVSLTSASAGPESPIQRLSRGEKSASPARSARFLESPLLEATKHKPPPRSTSPGKSALKGHSPRNMSPAGSRHRDSVALSDAGSAVSDESHTTGKKKKNVRVSFEERPILVGNAAVGGSPTDTVLSPQYKKALREAGEEEVNSMGDRPVLPSFGSVRGRKTPDDTPIEPDSPTRLVKPSTETINKATEEPAKSSLVAAPQIAVQPATPRAEDVDKLNESTPPATEASMSAEHTSNVATSQPDYTAGIGDHPWATTHPTDDNESDTDDDLNAFSDAPETPEERAAGFRSLDAILESPGTEESNPLGGKAAIAPTTDTVEEQVAEEEAPQIAVATTTDTAVTLAAAVDPIGLDSALVDAITNAGELQSPEGEDWDTVKAYWSSLSEQKKREMELQANADTSGVPIAADPASAPKPIKSALKKSSVAHEDHDQRLPPWPDTQYQQNAKSRAEPKARPTVQREPSDPTHMRSSMRSGGSMRTSMHEAPIHKSSRDGQQQKPSKPDAMTNASPEAIALARQFMPKREPKRRGSNDSDASDSSFRKRRGRNPEPRAQQYSMKRSMRDVAAAPSLRGAEMSPTGSAAGRRPMRASVRTGSIDSTTSEPKGGFLGLGKSKQKASKSKGKAASGPSFSSRFADSSDEEEGGGFASRLGGFRSRFANSDDDDSDYEPPMPAPRIPSAPSLTSRTKAPAAAPKKEPAPKLASAPQLAPVRGIPRRATDAESTDLSDSDDDVTAPRANVPAPATAANRPGTPPATTALNFGGKTSTDVPVSPQSPAAPQTNGAPAEGNALGAGTLRNHDSTPEKRRSIFSRSNKKKGALAESKWATQGDAPASPSSPAAARPETPSRMNKSMRARGNSASKDSPRSNSFLRRLSLTGGGSAPTTPSGATHTGKGDFPFPPPPIPEEYGGPGAYGYRPNTSDGVSSAGGARPPLGERMESSQTAPTSGRGGKLRKGEPVHSERTGRKKKFQGLRRAFGLTD